MRVLIVHLSDIHVKSASDPVLERAPLIVNAVKDAALDIGLCIVATTGDVAFSGQEEQYTHAEAFLRAIADGLAKNLGQAGRKVPVHHVLVPGNHDCDFTDIGTAREIVLRALEKDPTDASDPSVIEICTKPQAAFASFLGRLSFPDRTAVGQLYYEYEVELGEGTGPLRVLCCNTAWMSRKEEQQGSLFFPSQVLPARRPDDQLTIAAFHHPYNWLNASSASLFRKSIEGIVDVVITGHEHDPETVSLVRSSGANNTYIAGGVLQESNAPDLCSFNAIVVDTTSKKQLINAYEWDGERFVSVHEKDDREAPRWEEFQANRLRIKGRFSFSKEMIRWLQDPGISLFHSRLKTIHLEHIFVYPDLKETPKPGSSMQASAVRGERVADFLAGVAGHLLVVGDNESGKTSLVKMLAIDLLGRGSIPIVINAADDKLELNDKLRGLLEDKFVRQYEDVDRETFRQLPRERRVVIIDDYHKVTLPQKRKRQLLDQLSQLSGSVLLFAHDIIIGMEGFAHADPSSALSSYRIQPFGYQRRDQLVERWLQLGEPDEQDAGAFVRALNQITHTLDSIIGKNFVPAYPPYILAVLQATHAATPVDTRASTHGYFYELFIRTALAKGRTSVQYDIVMSYLAYLAHHMLAAGTSRVGLSALKKWHDEYEKLHEVQLDFDASLEMLTKQRVLEMTEDEVGFAYGYVYYYFVAAYLRDHLEQASTKQTIRDMAHHLELEENANVLLFLAHLSRDSLIISEMLSAARQVYSECQPAGLSEDTAFLSELGGLTKLITVYADSDPRQSRAEVREALDENAGTEIVKGSDPTNPLVRMSVAIKTLQILGQIVKNFPGSLEGTQKGEIVGECCAMGLRAMTWLFDFTKTNQKEVLQDCADAIAREHPTFPRERILDKAQNAVSSLVAMSSLGLVKRISVAIGSPELDKTYDRVFSSDVPAHKLVRLSIALDQANPFPLSEIKSTAAAVESRPLAKWILQMLATVHFRMFPVQLPAKQSACAALGIKYEQVNPSYPKLLKS